MGQVIYPEQFRVDDMFICYIPKGVTVYAMHKTPFGLFFDTNQGLMAPYDGWLAKVQAVRFDIVHVNDCQFPVDIHKDNVTPMDRS